MAILFRAAWLMVRTGVGPATPFTFAHRARCAAAIFRRAAAETVRLVLSVPGWLLPSGRLSLAPRLPGWHDLIGFVPVAIPSTLRRNSP